MRFLAFFAVVLFVLFSGLNAFAGDGPACQAKDGAKAEAKTCPAAGGGAPSCHSGGEKAACGANDPSGCCKGVPCMKYKVGDKTVCSADEAKTLAKGDAKAIKFVVDGKDYADQGEALTAYSTVLDKFMGDMMKVQYVVGDEVGCCANTAKSIATKSGKPVQYRVAAVTFEKQDQAEKALKAAQAAADKIAMKMVVGGETYACPMEAKTACDKSGKQIEYVIGETKTPCKVTAQVELLKAKISAARKAAEEATKA